MPCIRLVDTSFPDSENVRIEAVDASQTATASMVPAHAPIGFQPCGAISCFVERPLISTVLPSSTDHATATFALIMAIPFGANESGSDVTLSSTSKLCESSALSSTDEHASNIGIAIKRGHAPEPIFRAERGESLLPLAECIPSLSLFDRGGVTGVYDWGHLEFSTVPISGGGLLAANGLR